MTILWWTISSLLLCMVLYTAPADYQQDTTIMLYVVWISLLPGMALQSAGKLILLLELTVFFIFFSLGLAALYINTLITAGGFGLLGVWCLLHMHPRIGVKVKKDTVAGMASGAAVFFLFIMLFLYF